MFTVVYLRGALSITLACHLHGAAAYSTSSLKCLLVGQVTFTLYRSTFIPLSHPLLPQFRMTQLSVCTSWHLNMWNVTDYRAHSLVPSAAVRASAVSISFQERQAEGQRATFIYIAESHSNSLMRTVTSPKHQIYTADLTYANATKGIKLSIQVEKRNKCVCDSGGAS